MGGKLDASSRQRLASAGKTFGFRILLLAPLGSPGTCLVVDGHAVRALGKAHVEDGDLIGSARDLRRALAGLVLPDLSGQARGRGLGHLLPASHASQRQEQGGDDEAAELQGARRKSSRRTYHRTLEAPPAAGGHISIVSSPISKRDVPRTMHGGRS